ncbi:hypothetical protein N7470_008453 [Penicillium chermesinum]|nr:hypothetical protein N7470_008453 [Penicillium chermesinum]
MLLESSPDSLWAGNLATIALVARREDRLIAENTQGYPWNTLDIQTGETGQRAPKERKSWS